MMTKTITFACVHFSIAFTVAWLITGSVITGGLLALIEPMCNTVAFYFHEKVWMLYKKRQQPAKADLAFP